MALAEIGIDFSRPAENAETVVYGTLPCGVAFVEITRPKIRIFPGGKGTALCMFSWQQHIDGGFGYLGKVINPCTQINIDRESGEKKILSFPVETDALVVLKSPDPKTASGIISWDGGRIPHNLNKYVSGILFPHKSKVIDY